MCNSIIKVVDYQEETVKLTNTQLDKLKQKIRQGQ